MSLGLHIKAAGFDTSLIPSIIKAKPDIIVVVGSSGDLQLLRQFYLTLGDTCSYGFRYMGAEPWIEALLGVGDPVDTAAGWLDDISVLVDPNQPDPVERIKTIALDWSFVTWQSLNEQSGSRKWQADYDKARIDLAVKYGIRVGICAWGYGQPEVSDWSIYDPALRAAFQAGPKRARLILHNYWSTAEPNNADRTFLMRPLDLADYCFAHGMQDLWDKQVEYWEYGRDVPGWRAFPGLMPATYVDQLFEADSFSPFIPKAIYDCSIIPDDAGEPHWHGIQENFIITPAKPHEPAEIVRPIDLILARMEQQHKVMPKTPSAPPVQPPPVTPPPAPGPVVVTLINPDMEQPALSMPGNGTPTGWEYGYNGKQAEVHFEIEQHPTHVKTGRQSARLWGVGSWQGWLYQRFDTVPGATYTALLDTLATVTDVVDGASLGKVKQKIALDPSGNTDPSAPVFVVVANSDQWVTLETPGIKATGPRMTIFYKVENDNQRRADAFLDNVRIVMIPAASTDLIPLPSPIAVTVAGASGYLRVRSTPVKSDPPTNETGRLPNGHRFYVKAKTQDGKWYQDESGGYIWAELVK